MPNKVYKFWQELKRRNVIKVLIMYAGVAIVLIGLASDVAGPFNLPDWAPRLIIILVIIGLPIAVILSWVFDITPEGIQKTGERQGTTGMGEQNPVHDYTADFKSSVAVLPFQDMSPQKDQEYFCDGISEEIINVLTRVERLKVIARTSAFAFKGRQMDIRDIGKTLGVENILEGSIRKDGKQLRITAQLIRVNDGSHLWSEAYNRELKDIFTIQEDISLTIVDKLKMKLVGEEKAEILKRPTDNVEAYQYYLKGLSYWQTMTPEGNRLAQENYMKAIEKDPQFALVWATLGSNYLFAASIGLIPTKLAVEKSSEYTSKALEIDSNMSIAHSSLAAISMAYDWNMKEAEREFKMAIQLNPNSGWDHFFYSSYLKLARRFDEAIAESNIALELDPFNIYISTQVGTTYLMAGLVDEAIEKQKWTIGIYPNNYMAHQNLGDALQAKSALDDALTEYETAVNLSDGNLTAVSRLACAYYQTGDTEKAEELIQDIKSKLEKQYVPASVFIPYYIVKKEFDQAYTLLERALSERDFNLLYELPSPVSEYQLPDESRFTDLLKKFGYLNF
jgi:adenylate cyclase